ncbi:hypothetical protein SAMN05660662_1393 [Blastococcus aurantiacus]|uniref:Uncharacterized protein n=1 Tax=Blastococcus aurantiacus TaxID=1550231 RepID=A0A1G7JAA7_9ACTN|nr:hypothetical protein [Blastococcus aurantiacus]SDF21907.1 hypothetical protein SAMN05660662_1393 [Blastococcus aurantiacus]
MSGLQISVPGHGRWLPLPLEGDIDAQASAAASALTRQASGDRMEDVAALIAGSARTVLRQAGRLAQDGIVTALAWSLLPAPGVLQPGPVALLRLFPLAPTASDDDVLTTVVDVSADRHGDIDVDRLDTASGPALTVRWRPAVRGEDGIRMVHEQRAVLWPDREHEVVLVLSLYVVDLVDGASAGEPLQELATAVRWSLS